MFISSCCSCCYDFNLKSLSGCELKFTLHCIQLHHCTSFHIINYTTSHNNSYTCTDYCVKFLIQWYVLYHFGIMNDNNSCHLNCDHRAHHFNFMYCWIYKSKQVFHIVNIPKTFEPLNGRKNEEEEEIIIMGLNESELTMPKYQAIYVIVRKFVIWLLPQ